MEDPKKLLQEANGFLRNAERNMFSGKNNDAVEQLNKAEEIGTLAKQNIPDDAQVKMLFQKIEKIRKDLERKGVATRAGGNNTLPFEAQAQLSRIRDHIVRKELDWAKKELDVYYSRFAGPLTEIAEIKEFKEHIQKLEVEANNLAKEKAETQKANAEMLQKHEELCREWEQKLKSIPYFDGTPQNTQSLLEHKISFGKAIEVMNELDHVTFSAQKSITIDSLSLDIRQRIQMFPQNYAETCTLLANEIQTTIEERIDFLNRDTAWTSDTSLKPHIIGKSDLENFAKQIEEIQPLFVDNASGLDGVNNALASLHNVNDMRKFERSKRTTIKPAAITGNEASEAIDAAIKALNIKHPNAKVLKSVVTRNWEDKRIEGWADNTKTQWVVKNLSETTVQIAAEQPNGNCFLFSLHVEKDKAPNGLFGEPRCHIMFEELMAKETVS